MVDVFSRFREAVMTPESHRAPLFSIKLDAVFLNSMVWMLAIVVSLNQLGVPTDGKNVWNYAQQHFRTAILDAFRGKASC